MVTDIQAKDNVATNVSRLLENLGLSQGELARKTGESKMRISLVVRGVHQPTAGFLARLAEALGVTADDLLSAPEKKNGKSRRSA